MRTCIFCLTAALLAVVASQAQAERLFGLTDQNGIVVFDSALPTVPVGGGAVTGLASGDTLVGIDYQPLTGKVFLLGSQSNIYTLNSASGTDFTASQVGVTLSPILAGTNYAFDFNPSLDMGAHARIITNTDNNRVITGATGAYLGTVEKTPVFYATGDANVGADPNIAGIAYNNNVAAAPSTQQFGIDASLGVLTTVANNAGTLTTVGSLGLTAPFLSDDVGFDISGASGAAYASINSILYTVDLSLGSASLVGLIGLGNVVDLTTVPVPEPSTLTFLALGCMSVLARRKSR